VQNDDKRKENGTERKMNMIVTVEENCKSTYYIRRKRRRANEKDRKCFL